MKADGSTNIGDALRRGYYLLNNNNGHDKYIVMLTDGQAEAYSTNWNDQFKMDDGGAEKAILLTGVIIINMQIQIIDHNL